MSKIVETMAADAIKSEKSAKALNIALACSIANYKFENGNSVGDGIFAFGEYDDDAESITFKGDSAGLFTFNHQGKEFIVTGAQRQVSKSGYITLILRDDRPGISRTIEFGKLYWKVKKTFAEYIESVLKINLDE